MADLRPSRWYRVAVATAARAARLGARFDGKIARGLAARHGLADRYSTWAAAHRDPRRPLVWFHAPSVGEGLQAKPVLEALRAARPEWQLAYSFFSPSAERLAKALPVDFTDYLPLDRLPDVRAGLETLAPTALVYAKLDVWPELTLAAAARGTRLGLISATVAPSSSRLAWPVRVWASPAYAALDRIGAISAEDAARLERLGARRATITITGDTRYDSVAERAERLDRSSEPLASLTPEEPDTFTIVAGSTWPADEAVVLPAFAEFASRGVTRGTRLILAPHEPSASHLAAVDTAAERCGLPRPLRLSQIGTASPGRTTVILVDRVGVLADLYALGQAAYVGGGYHRAGLHSALEPAAFGVPMCVGPGWTMSRDAGVLLHRGGAVALPEDGRQALVNQWLTWLGDPVVRARAGAAAAAVVREGRGAAARTAALVQELVDRD
ncbi:MAG TPA: glycosyltransferase N-terminal domain-containing protein [Gemmatimonadales bacterium]|jgi:3-deoxy-D-manno-octulosonic-acid transferase